MQFEVVGRWRCCGVWLINKKAKSACFEGRRNELLGVLKAEATAAKAANEAVKVARMVVQVKVKKFPCDEEIEEALDFADRSVYEKVYEATFEALEQGKDGSEVGKIASEARLAAIEEVPGVQKANEAAEAKAKRELVGYKAVAAGGKKTESPGGVGVDPGLRKGLLKRMARKGHSEHQS